MSKGNGEKGHESLKKKNNLLAFNPGEHLEKL